MWQSNNSYSLDFFYFSNHRSWTIITENSWNQKNKIVGYKLFLTHFLPVLVRMFVLVCCHIMNWINIFLNIQIKFLKRYPAIFKKISLVILQLCSSLCTVYGIFYSTSTGGLYFVQLREALDTQPSRSFAGDNASVSSDSGHISLAGMITRLH